MATVRVTKLGTIGTVFGNDSVQVTGFNTALNKLADDMTKEYSKIYAHRNSFNGAAKLMRVTPLKKLKTVKGSSNVQRAAIEIFIKQDSLSNFPFEMRRITVARQSYYIKKSAKHRKRPIIAPITNKTVFMTLVKVKKSSPMVQVRIPRKMNSSTSPNMQRAINTRAKGFYYDKNSMLNPKDLTKISKLSNPNMKVDKTTPSGMYIRSTKKRYPLMQLRNLPIAYLLNSKTTLEKVNFTNRINGLIMELKLR
jgi:hypothetical protein